MQCKCGGSTITREQPRIKKGKLVEKLEFPECTACGRVGTKTLTRYNPDTGKIIASHNI